MLADQHKPDRSSVGQAARYRHGRMTRDVEGAGIRQHFERALHDLGFGRRRAGKGRCSQRQRRHEEQVVFRQRGIIGRPKDAAEILAFGVISALVFAQNVFARQHRHLERFRKLVRRSRAS